MYFTSKTDGWTFEGGIPGASAGRMYGHGVDQVLQIEMVLPNGLHVKFGPTKWEDAEGYLVPKTISVTGLCRTNPEESLETNGNGETVLKMFRLMICGLLLGAAVVVLGE